MPHSYGQADSLLLVMKRLAYPNCHVLLEGGHYEQPLLPPSLQQEQQAYPPPAHLCLPRSPLSPLLHTFPWQEHLRPYCLHLSQYFLIINVNVK